MEKKILKGIAVGLALLVMTLFVLYVNRSDPYGILPGKQLVGEEATEPIDDWSFVQQYRRVTVEVRPSDPYSVDIRAYLHLGVLYLNSITPEHRWTQYLLEDPNLRLKVENKIYQVRATWIEDPVLVSEIQKAREQMSPRLAQRTSQEKAQNGYFRIDSR